MTTILSALSISLLSIESVMALSIPVVGSMGLFLTIFGIRYLQHREKLIMLEKGIAPKFPDHPRKSFYPALRIALLLIGAGLGLSVGFYVNRMLPVSETAKLGIQDDGDIIYVACVFIFGGIGLLIASLMERKASR